MSTSMSYVFPPTNFELTPEEFNLFYNTDRHLFTRLVRDLGRNHAESMHILALWLWLERAQYCHNLVHRILALPLALVEDIADEAVLILSCIERDDFPLKFVNKEIVLTPSYALNEISLHFFHRIRMAVLRGVTQMVQEVCSRAFQYIPENNNRSINYQNSILGLPVTVRDQRARYVPFLEGGHNISSTHNVGVPQNVLLSNSLVGPYPFMRGDVLRKPEISCAFNDEFDLSRQRHILGTELSDLLKNFTLNDNDQEEEENVPADDRTIFLTFSKGYPITEVEVYNFITRRFGRDCIEAIYMQAVLPNEQALYARLVMKSASTISLVLEGQSRTKFSINRKHVWARKYVKKQPRQAQGASTSSAGVTRRN